MSQSDFIQAIEKESYRRDFHIFLLRAYEVIEPNDKLIDNWHLKYICGKLQKEVERIRKGEKKQKDLMLVVPPRSLKTIICVCLTAWTWIDMPSMKFIRTSYQAELSMDNNVLTRRLIESDWYQNLWGVKIVSDQNTKTNFENESHGYSKSTSIGGAITGKGANIILIDDPLDPKQASSDVERQTAINYIDKTLPTRLNNFEVDMFIYIMQRQHENDPIGHLLNKLPEKHEYICIPAEVCKTIHPPELIEYYKNGLFFPKRFTSEVLEILKIKLGSNGYNCQILQNPLPDEGNVFKANWFNIINENELPEELVWDIWIDGAYTDKTKNDPTGILVTAFKNNKMYIKNRVHKWMELPALLKYLPEFAKANNYNGKGRAMIEPKASGKSIKQMLINSTLNAIEIGGKVVSDGKITRATAASPTVEAGKVFLIKGNWNQEFIEQVTGFPNAKHDEDVDNLSYAVNDYFLKRGSRYIFI